MNEDTQTMPAPAAASDTELAQFSWTDYEWPSTGVVEAVSAVTGQDTTELPQLGHVIDPDALNSLVANQGRGERSDVDVTFSYAGVTVSIDSTGNIHVSKR